MEYNNLHREIIENALHRLDESTRMIRTSFDKLSEQDIWKKPNTSSNSVGNLMLHLCGNMHQYIISSLGNTPDIREREKEFSTDSGYTSEELLALLEEKVERVKEVISSCSAEDMLLKREVQGFNLSGLGIIIHVVEHYSYHTGQIAFWTKILNDQDLDFYRGVDLNSKNIET